MKLGMLGGTFDPVHIGHLVLAEEARCALGLDRVLLMPAAQPWRKADRTITPAALRLAMLQAAVAHDPYFEVSTVEIDRGGPTYSVDTLAALRAELAPEDELVFILGEDALRDLPHWREPRRIVELARLGVAARPAGGQEPDLRAALAEVEAKLPGIRARVQLVPMTEIGISSTEIRRRAAQGGALRYLVPDPVLALIAEHGLYR